MRVALVSPYSWTYPGGVTRHIEALASELLAQGHDVRVLAPFDHDDRRTALMHRGMRPQRPPLRSSRRSVVTAPGVGARFETAPLDGQPSVGPSGISHSGISRSCGRIPRCSQAVRRLSWS